MAYATIADLESRWRELSTDEETRATALLDDAATIIDALVTVGDDKLEVAKIVSCDMVTRAMSASAYDMYGVSNSSMTAGSYTQSWTYSNPSGDIYLTKLEKKLLGIGASYIGSIPAKVGHDD